MKNYINITSKLYISLKIVNVIKKVYIIRVYLYVFVRHI
jgi:hypothetical protein